MQAYTYVSKGKFELREKPKPTLMQERDAIVKVTLASICSSDLHIKHGSVPRAVPGITVGHEMVGIVEEVGKAVTKVKPGDRVTVNVETFCGECFFCKKGYVNNCTDENGGWALGCRIDGGQAEYVRVPFADQGLNKIPDGVTDRQALLVGDVLATGYWAARISEISEQDTVLIIGAGPTGICTLLSVMLKKPRRIIVCEKDKNRLQFIRQHYPEILLVSPVKPLFIILAKAVPYFVLSFVNLTTILLLSVYVLDVPVAGSLFWLIVVSLFFIFVSLALGLLISSVTRTQVAAMLASGLILMMPTMLLSGMIFPIESMPLLLQGISAVLPARWYIQAVRKLMIEGVDISLVLTEVSILAVMAVALITISFKKFKNRLE